jgi:hypothetical protein
MSTMLDVNNWLGVSQWDDAPLNGEINELRIYEGALGEFEIVLSRRPVRTRCRRSRPLQSIALEAPDALLNGNPQTTKASLLATYENMAGVDVSTLSSTLFTSSDPASSPWPPIGELLPVASAAELTAEYGGLSETAQIEVLNPRP